MSPIRFLLIYLLAWCLLSIGCGPEDARPGLPLAVPPTETVLPQIVAATGTASVTGRITFEKLHVVNAAGQVQTRTVTVEPLRFVDVEARDSKGVTISPTASTNANGEFTLAVQPNTDFTVNFISSTAASAGRFNAEVRSPVTPPPLYVVRFAQGQNQTPFPGAGAGTLTTLSLATLPSLTLAAGSTIRTGAIANILDAVFTASEAVRNVNALKALPRITMFWSPGSRAGAFFTFLAANNTQPAIFLKGGDSDTDDTDEFDDAVIQHEYGHFTASQLTRDVSLGGEHAFTDQIYPTLAYSEGLASWFAGAVAKIPAYFDTQGITGAAPLVGLFNMETRGTQNFSRGRTSEASVAEVLWDLADGTEGRTSTDNDPLALSFQQIFTALGNLQTSKVYVVVDDLLNQLVANGVLSTVAAQQIPQSPENQGFTFTGGDVYPTAIAPPGTAADQCLTVNSTFGVDSGVDGVNRFFKFDLATDTNNVSISVLLPTATGTDATGSNINLFLIDSTNKRIGSSETTTNFESILVPTLPKGRYYIHVSGRPSPFNGDNFTNQAQVLVDYQLGLQ